VSALLLLLALQGAIDSGTFVVRHDSLELARETFDLRAIEGAGGPGGWVLVTRARYEGDPTVRLLLTLDIASDSVPWSFEFEVADPRRPLRILGQASPERFTVRALGRRSERAREYSLTGPTVVLDDSLYCPYLFVAWQARTGQVVTLTALVPRGERRETLSVEDLGVVATTLNRDPATLRHLVVSGGATTVHVWLDASGRLMKVDVPARGLRIERVPPA
jgi:hypothetical protein